MAPQRPPHALPGSDPLIAQKVLGTLYFFLAAFFLVLQMILALVFGSPRGHWPWPLAQWALMTPLGTLVQTVVVGLVWSIPSISLARLNLRVIQLVDVTDLQVDAWPRPAPPFGDPASDP